MNHLRKMPLSVRLSIMYLLIVASCVATMGAPRWILWGYLAVSVVTFALYGLDKSAAQRGAWRTSEKTLHALALCGGWPGALAAQELFRHKTRKQPFRTIFWCTVGLNVLAFICLLTPEGRHMLQQLLASVNT